MKIKASAPATVANQPAFDQGGFAVKVEEVLLGDVPEWMNFRDTVTLDAQSGGGKIKIVNKVSEEDVPELPIEPSEHTATRPILRVLEILKEKGIDFNYNLDIVIEKGLSIKGTGLGSSGATPAAALLAFEEILKKLDIKLELSDTQKAEILKDSDFGVPDNAIPAYFGSMVTMSQPGEGNFSIEKLEVPNDFGKYLLIIPQDFGIRTEDARNALKGLSSPGDNREVAKKMKDFASEGNLEEYTKLMSYVHEWWVEPRSQLYPVRFFSKVKTVLGENKCLSITISGGGPAMLAWLSGKEDLEKLTNDLNEVFNELKQDVLVVKGSIDNDGAKLV